MMYSRSYERSSSQGKLVIKRVSFKFRKLLIGENIKTNKLLKEEIKRGVFN